jgi:hypothetical protein
MLHFLKCHTATSRNTVAADFYVEMSLTKRFTSSRGQARQVNIETEGDPAGASAITLRIPTGNFGFVASGQTDSNNEQKN